MGQFQIESKFAPSGDQPTAIDSLVSGLKNGERIQTLLGATGTGKSFSAAQVIQRVQRPTLVIAHNKTLAAQLCSEFRDFFPNNAVEYFVSYYDYFTPEAYIPQTDTFIEKDSSVNEEIDRLRHSATQAVLERRDVIIVASVSCIYGLGSPSAYKGMMVWFHTGQTYDRDDVLRRLVNIQFQRNDMVLGRGTFRVKGDVLEICPKDEEIVYRIDFDWDTVKSISVVDHLTGEILETKEELTIFPASHFVSDPDKMESILLGIEAEMRGQVATFEAEGKLLEAQRIEQRTKFDLEMIREVGYCSGVENYSRWFDGRAPGTAPNTLFDYFPDDMLLIVDESHQTIPQLHAMYAGDKRRKDTLVEYGFRLPSAKDNRPLRFEEFEERIKQVVFVSATPGPYERQHSTKIAEQVIRPTGLLDPEIVIRPTKGQIDDLISEIKIRTERGERVIVTTLTKKMSEDLTEYLVEIGTKVQYLHSEIRTLERTEILRDLRLGVYDVVVGINLLREGLDLPEVSLVTILDADKEGFLRSETSLIQTIGRAARNVGGQVIMYADRITGSMERAIDETNRRRAKQVAYNAEHGITPQTVIKAVREVLESKKVAESKAYYKVTKADAAKTMPLDELVVALADMEKEMKQAAKALDFEHAAQLRDEMGKLKKLLPMDVKREMNAPSGVLTPPKSTSKFARKR
ncbi:MAG: excinuclease ABC subunit UvrB [Armatimonadetes bacterium]|nr:excinuclease ABC subunit UvrB [Armatimonadota bacterium]